MGGLVNYCCVGDGVSPSGEVGTPARREVLPRLPGKGCNLIFSALAGAGFRRPATLGRLRGARFAFLPIG